MATRTLSPGARGMEGLRRQWADPLARNGYALVANTGATGLSGLVYWVLVARLYPTDTVGRASAAYAAMNLLAGFTALNFNGALTRFLPQAGRHTAKLIKHSYLVSAVASVLVTIPFLLSIHLWGPSYSELGNPITGLFFIGCVVCWAIFTLQDSVLAGLRTAHWVLLENTLFGITKVVLLIIFASRFTHLGIYLSWMVPCVLVVPLINLLIFSRLVPRHTAATIDVEPPTNRQIGRFLAGDYSGAMFLLATSNLVPVLVAAMISDVKNTAYFYMAWLVGGILDLVAVNMAISLTVEGSFDASSLARHCRQALKKIGLLVVPGRRADRAARAVGPGPVRTGVCQGRRADPATAGAGHVAQNADRGVPGRAAGAEPDPDGGHRAGHPRGADARPHRLAGPQDGPDRRGRGCGDHAARGGRDDQPRAVAGAHR